MPAKLIDRKPLFLLAILGIVSPYHVVVFAVEHFNAWLDVVTRRRRNAPHLNLPEHFDRRTSNLFLQDVVEVLDVSLLGGLSSATASLKSHLTVVGESVDEVCCKAGVEE